MIIGITEDERVIASALTNLNKRTLNTITSYTAADTKLSSRIDVLENTLKQIQKDIETVKEQLRIAQGGNAMVQE